MRLYPRRSRPAPRHLREDPRPRVSTWREATYLAVLTTMGGALLACGFWVTGAGAIFDETVRDEPSSQPAPRPAPEPAAATRPAPELVQPQAEDVEGGPDLDPAD